MRLHKQTGCELLPHALFQPQLFKNLLQKLLRESAGSSSPFATGAYKPCDTAATSGSADNRGDRS